MKEILLKRIEEIKQAGTYKNERIITSSQNPLIKSEGRQVLNFCSNNYLGLASNPQVNFFNILVEPTIKNYNQ